MEDKGNVASNISCFFEGLGLMVLAGLERHPGRFKSLAKILVNVWLANGSRQ